MSTLRSYVSSLLFLFPAGAGKNFLLRKAGHRVNGSARVGPCVVIGPTRFDLGDDVFIGAFNVFHNVRSVTLDNSSIIGRWNWFSSLPGIWHRSDSYGRLHIGEHSHVVSRHIFDCSGGVVIGRFSTVAGCRSVFLTHEIDYTAGRQTYGRITVGDYCLVNACNQFVKDSRLPSRSVTGIGALVRPGMTEEGLLYGGVPVRAIKPVGGAYFERTSGMVMD